MTMNIWKKTVGFIVVAGIILSVTGCTTTGKKTISNDEKNGSSVAAIKKRGEINIAVFGDLSPYGYLDATGNNQGYDVYLANQIGRDLGVKVNFVIVNADRKSTRLNSSHQKISYAVFC